MANQQAFHRRTTTASSSGMPSSPSAAAYSVSPPANVPGSFSAMMAAQQASPSANAHAIHASTSPSAPGAVPIPGRTRKASVPYTNMPKLLTPFNTSSIKILLLEAVSLGAVEMLQKQGYQVDYHKDAWSEEQLIDRIGEYNVIGIRSKTKLTEKVFHAAHKVRSSMRKERGLRLIALFCLLTLPSPLYAAMLALSCSPLAASASAPTRSTSTPQLAAVSVSSTLPLPTRARSQSSSSASSSPSRASSSTARRSSRTATGKRFPRAATRSAARPSVSLVTATSEASFPFSPRVWA